MTVQTGPFNRVSISPVLPGGPSRDLVRSGDRIDVSTDTGPEPLTYYFLDPLALGVALSV